MELVLGREDVIEAVVEGAVDEDVAAVAVAGDGMVWDLVWRLLLVALRTDVVMDCVVVVAGGCVEVGGRRVVDGGPVEGRAVEPEEEVLGGGREAGGPRGVGGGPRGVPSSFCTSGAFLSAVMCSLDLEPSLYSMKDPVMSRSFMTYSGVRLTSFLFLRSSSMVILSKETWMP